MAWTAPEKTDFRKRWEAGETVSVIAAAMGKSESSIKYQRAAMGLAERRPPPLEDRIRVGLPGDTYSLFRNKARRNGQTLAGRLRHLINEDLKEP